MGNNFDGCAGTIAGMLSDRLDNPKFLGPADPVTGIAAGWGSHTRREQGARYALVPGMGLSGSEAQLVHVYGESAGSIQQTRRRVRAGERLEVELWAMAAHRPVKLCVGIKPWPSRQPAYATAEVLVDAAYWRPYRVELSAPRDDNDAVFFCRVDGPGVLWLDQVHLRPAGGGDVNRPLLERMRSLRIASLRFPGSCLSTIYRWKHGTGPRHLRPVEPDPIFGWQTCYDFGTDEYLDLCLDQGIRPHIVIDIGRGTPDEAAEWAAYCHGWFRQRGVEPPPAYFNMGNEQHGTFESSHMTGTMYAAALREFVPGIRRAYPGARIVAIGEKLSGGLWADEQTPWRQTVLDEAPGHFDIVSIHRYPGRWHDDPAARMADTVDSVLGVERDLRGLADECRPLGDRVRIGLDEWNLWLHAGHDDGKGFLEPYDAQHGLFAARMINMLGRFGPELELAAFYQLVNVMGIFKCAGGCVEETSMVDVLRLYRPAFPGQCYPVSVQSPSIGMGQTIDALHLRNDAGAWLFLVNSSPTESADVALEGFPVGQPERVGLAGAHPSAALAPADLATAGGAMVVPPLSASRLRWKPPSR
jgi:alpha-N-arabinofuranosidase